MTPTVQRIVLITDFGPGLYVGQLQAWLTAWLPQVPILDLIHDLTPFRPDLAGYLLPAMVRDMPSGTLYVCVVDPGVGGARAGLLIETPGAWFIGPDNGLFAPLVRATPAARPHRIGWQPEQMSASFHARDWFVPAAHRWVRGQSLDLSRLEPAAMVGGDWPSEQAAILYRDHFGNLMTGLRAQGRSHSGLLHVGDRLLRHARTFCEAPSGMPFWYENSLGLIEIAVNQGSAQRRLGLVPGDPVGPFCNPDGTRIEIG
ncbi:SAM hydrolase/SAM-dependent halogenase family protein [Thiocapsa imhoffii]